MKLIESKAEYIPQATVPSASAEELLEGIYKQIELAGRTAYHSSPKYRYWTSDRKYFINEGTEDFKLLYNPEEYPIKQNISAKDFVDRMIKSNHGAALEHGTVYLQKKIDYSNMDYNEFEEKVEHSPYSKTNYDAGMLYVTSNMRVLQENNWLDDLQYLCSPTEFHEKRYTMRFTCSRAIAQELTRHRVFSFLMESQRYINYSKERHGGEIIFIIPSNFGWKEQTLYKGDFEKSGSGSFDSGAWINSLLESESTYKYLLHEGWTPQQARDVLPNATKTELIMTGFSSDWRFLMDLRLFEKTGRVHPDMLDLMQKAQKAMQKASIWEDIMSKPSKFK